MKVSRRFIVPMMLWLCISCASTSTPTPSPVPTPVPSPTLNVSNPTGVLSTVIMNRLAPDDVPACPGAQELEKPIEFSWTGIEDVRQSTPESNWIFYRCDESQTMLSAFYRRWMPEPQYHWVQMHWEERADTTLGVFYFSASASGAPNRWLYLWFLPDSSSRQTSYLVVAWWQVPKSC
jgi:hypothetical protein